MIDHFNIPVTNLIKAEPFYRELLAELGYVLIARDRDAIGFGKTQWTVGLVQTEGAIPALHLALSAPDRQAVDRFHLVGLAEGGIDNGKPGYRPQYGTGYYACYIIDPDGHNVEAVCRNG